MEQPPRLPFPVIGIGASAGGLEAFTEFFQAMPADSGMAFVLIQHLPPERESLLAEILARSTAMRVLEVADGLRVEPNHVYVIRPGRTLTIRQGALRLGEPVHERGHTRPVDDFFRSLAEEQRESAIAIIMSGMGSNGTAGARAVKAVGGLCIAQEPVSAKFPSMPRSLVDSGLADFVVRPAEIPDLLVRYAAHPFATGKFSSGREPQALDDVFSLLRQRLRHDFTVYKKPTLVRRIERRMNLAQLDTIADYSRRLRQDPAELAALADDMTIHVTGFFRDPDVWEALRTKVIAPLVDSRASGSSIRAWVSACSSGEEAYTLAMLLVEAAEATGKIFELKIFATDTAERSLTRARTGIYPGGIESEISPERLQRFFERGEVNYQVKKALREVVTFAPQDILQDPPFSQLDLCTCRNLLIYLEPEVQRRALSLMHFGLREGGVLLLGNSETVGPMENLFTPLDKKHRLFRRSGPLRHSEIEFPEMHAPIGHDGRDSARSGPASRLSIAQLTNKALLDRHSPAAVVIDREQHIVYFHGHTARFLDQPHGEPTRELLSLAPEPLRGGLRLALQHALAHDKLTTVRAGVIETPAGRTRVEITVAPLERNSPNPAYFLVTFLECPELPAASTEPRHPLEDELQRTRDELRSVVQELRTGNDELTASNQEVTSINEELQSANEELETGKEELQSLNEELTTANAQLQAKMEELETTTNDLGSLLSSTDIAVVFLDRELRIRRFTPAVSDLFVLLPVDIGRPLTDLARKFRDDDLLTDAQSVLENLAPVEKEIVSDSGRAYARRTLPYRTTDHQIAGVVVTFVDITARIRAENALRESEEMHRLILKGIRDYAIFMLDPAGRITVWSPGAEHILGYAPGEAVGQSLSFVFGPEDRDTGRPEQELQQAREKSSIIQEGWRVRKNGTRFWGRGTLSVLKDSSGQLRGFVKILHDSTQRKISEEALRQAKRAADAANEAKDRFLANISHELRTPLSAIVLWASLIEDEKIAEPKQLAEALGAIRRSADEQHRLIEDLVDTARIAAGKLRLELRQIHIGDTVHAAVEIMRPLAQAKNVQIAERFDPGIVTVEADGSRLQQVVSNLVHNAIKFTPAGGHVSVELHQSAEEVRIEVADSGIGIDAEFLPRIFEPFVQANNPAPDNEGGGLGLGLSIVHQIVEAHGGSIGVESAGPGLGTTFSVRLPLVAMGSRSLFTKDDGELHLAQALAGRNVLLVEDIATTRLALSAVLQAAGADVTAIDSASAAWEALESDRPDIIVSDLSLPGIDGYTFIRQVRETENFLHAEPVPALALTAFASDSITRRALESGFHVCLTKPIAPAFLVSKLAAMIK